jgi:hypothetical protein
MSDRVDPADPRPLGIPALPPVSLRRCARASSESSFTGHRVYAQNLPAHEGADSSTRARWIRTAAATDGTACDPAALMWESGPMPDGLLSGAPSVSQAHSGATCDPASGVV